MSEPAARTTHRAMVVVAILLSMFMSAMEATVVSTAMPTVVADLRGIELYGWVGSIYMLATTVTIPLWGKLADLLGRKPVMLAGLAVFLLGSVASGAAGSMGALVAFRALQGVGAGALQPVALTIIADLFRVEERGRMQGLFGAVWGTAAMIGPLAGGVIVRALSWRWVFYVNVPFGVVSGLILFVFFREVRHATGPRKTLDLAGSAALAVCVVTLLLGVGGRAPWVTLPLAALSLAAFVWNERRAEEPILPPSLFAHRAVTVASVVGALQGATMMSTLMFVPLYIQAVRGGSPTAAGTAVAPMMLGWPLFSTLSGRLLPRVGPRALVRTGFALIAVGSVAVWWLLRAGVGADGLRAAIFVLGAGMGLVSPALVISVQESVALAQRGVATASTIFFRSIGGAVTVGALGTLLARRLAGVVDEAQLNALLGPERGRHVDARALAGMSDAIGQGMLPLFAIAAATGVAAAVVAMGFPLVRLSTARVEVTAEA